MAYYKIGEHEFAAHYNDPDSIVNGYLHCRRFTVEASWMNIRPKLYMYRCSECNSPDLVYRSDGGGHYVCWSAAFEPCGGVGVLCKLYPRWRWNEKSL